MIFSVSLLLILPTVICRAIIQERDDITNVIDNEKSRDLPCDHKRKTFELTGDEAKRGRVLCPTGKDSKESSTVDMSSSPLPIGKTMRCCPCPPSKVSEESVIEDRT